jgi:hypothetical protein
MFSYLWSVLMIIVRSFSFCCPSVTPSLVFVAWYKHEPHIYHVTKTGEGVTEGQQKEKERTMIIKALHR